MGVNLKDILSSEKIELKDLNGRIIAIDAANSIYQFLSGIRQRDGQLLRDANGRITSHLSGLFYRTTALVDKGVKPVYIFDGKPPELKGNTIKERVESRKKANLQWKDALAKGDMEEARKYAIRSSRMTPQVVEDSKKLLKLMGIPYIQAIGEGEAQASFMVQNGDAWAVASQDYDCLLFGAPRVIRNLTISGSLSDIEILILDDVLKSLEISREQLVDLAIMVGTDFNPGIKGIGAKRGLKFIKNKKTLEGALKSLDEDLGIDNKILQDIFLNYDVKKDYDLKWKKADQDGLVDFMCGEHDFSEERVIKTSKKLKSLDESQKSLEDWF